MLHPTSGQVNGVDVLCRVRWDEHHIGFARRPLLTIVLGILLSWKAVGTMAGFVTQRVNNIE
jgi:hypothetical protein